MEEVSNMGAGAVFLQAGGMVSVVDSFMNILNHFVEQCFGTIGLATLLGM